MRFGNRPHLVILGAGASLAAFPNGDKAGSRLPLMNNAAEMIGLRPTLDELGIQETNLEKIYPMVSGKAEEAVLQNKIREYFERLIPDEITSTIYDVLILSLTSKDFIATFNWDPLLLRCYQRVMQFTRDLPELLFLHGNAGNGICEKCQAFNFIWERCVSCGNRLTPMKLLYPIENKDYRSDLLIKEFWDKLDDALSRAYFVTIFGYSAPESDRAAVDSMIKAWHVRPRGLEEIEFVDIKNEREVIDTWSRLLKFSEHSTTHHYVINSFDLSWLRRYPRQSCKALEAATRLLNPIPDNPVPIGLSLDDLGRWFADNRLL